MIKLSLCIMFIGAVMAVDSDLREQEDRQRGITKWDVDPLKRVAFIKHEQDIKRGNHEVLATAYVQKNFQGKPTDQQGASVLYSNPNAGTSVLFKADHIQRQGTDLSLSGKFNIVNHKQGGVDLTGFYSTHTGGPGPRTSDRGVMLTGHVDLP